jgi:hypothetical protein
VHIILLGFVEMESTDLRLPFLRKIWHPMIGEEILE